MWKLSARRGSRLAKLAGVAGSAAVLALTASPAFAAPGPSAAIMNVGTGLCAVPIPGGVASEACSGAGIQNWTYDPATLVISGNSPDARVNPICWIAGRLPGTVLWFDSFATGAGTCGAAGEIKQFTYNASTQEIQTISLGCVTGHTAGALLTHGPCTGANDQKWTSAALATPIANPRISILAGIPVLLLGGIAFFWMRRRRASAVATA
jgi:hypothetical protein